MKRSKSRSEDNRRSEERVDNVTKNHGGQVVEAVSEEELESVHDAECLHKELVRDYSETDFIGFTCANPKCSEVFLYNKDK